MAHYADPSTDSRQVLRGTAETLSVTFYSGEAATDADGAVTIGIVDESGATVVASGTSTSSSGSGVYTYALEAQTDLKKLTATWTGTWGTVMTWSICHTESASSSWAPSSDPGALGAGRRPGLSASKSGPASVASFAFGLYCQAMTEPSLVHASSRFVD